MQSVAILLAIPLALWEGDNKLANWFMDLTGLKNLAWPGVIFLAGVAFLIYRRSTQKR